MELRLISFKKGVQSFSQYTPLVAIVLMERFASKKWIYRLISTITSVDITKTDIAYINSTTVVITTTVFLYYMYRYIIKFS